MAFVGIEFLSNDDKEAGIIALVHNSWLTPLKNQVWWPPYKTSAQFKKALFIEEEVKKDWTLYNVKRIFFACDELNKANKKLKECEEFSDLQSTELEDEVQHKKRKRKPNLKYTNNYISSEDEGQENFDSLILLAHICDDVEIYGPLDEYSAFPFENYLGRLKKHIKSSTNPLQQIYRRLQESNPFLLQLNERKLKNLDKDKYFLDMEHTDGPLLNNSYKWHKQYKKITFANLIFTVNQYSMSNSYCSLKDNTKIVQIHNIIKTTKGDVYLIGKHFIEYSPLYLYPCDSSLLNIYVVKNLSDLKVWPVNLIDSKCILLPYINDNTCYVCLPLVHRFD